MKRIFALTLCSLTATHMVCEAPVPRINTAQFIVEQQPVKKGASKQSLKEDIGHEMKDALHQCVALSQTLGQLQLQLAQMQSQLFSSVESLIDNEQQFKKARRPQLAQSLQVMRQTTSALQRQVHDMQKLKSQLDADVCLRKA